MPETTAERTDSGTGPRDTETVRWYTRAFRIPRLIGKTHTGTPLWGGPYTIWQAVGFGAVLVLGFQTMPLWARYGLLANGVLLFGSATAVGYLLGQIPMTGRNPVLVLAGLVHATAAPRYGTVAGRPLRLRPPHPAHAPGRVREPGAVPGATAPQPTGASRNPTPATGLRDLLARADSGARSPTAADLVRGESRAAARP